MRVAVVGGGIVGLFTAWYLEREGAEVTLFEEAGLGAGSIHAAGIIEPATAYRTNTLDFLRRVFRLWRNRTCVFHRADGHWLVESLRQLERTPAESMDTVLQELADTSVRQYGEFAAQRNDFAYSERGLIERFDDPKHFAQERDVALSRSDRTRVEVREAPGRAGALFFPQVSWLHTERFVERIARELPRTTVLHRRVGRVDLDGNVSSPKATDRFDVVAVCTGTGCRRLGVPLTGVRGYGWHVRSSQTPDVATISVDRGIALVPFEGEVKATGGWDFATSPLEYRARQVLEAVRADLPLEEVLDFKEGSRPCTPDGLPTVGRKGRLVVATGGFRLGWSFAPALGRHAALLCLDKSKNDDFLARYCSGIHSGTL
jgi:D-proline dehydrogenase